MRLIFEKKIAVVLATAIFLLIGCNNGIERAGKNISFEENPYAILGSIWEGFGWALVEGLSGVQVDITDHFGYGLYSPTFDPDNPFYGSLVLEDVDDVLAAVIDNVSLESNEFVFKLFLNYEEVSFRVLGTESYVTDLFFTLEPKQQVEFPFVLGIDNPGECITYKLTAAVFIDPSSHAFGEDNELWFGSANATSLDVSFGSGSEITLSQTYNYVPLEYQKNSWGTRNIDVWLADELYDIDASIYIDFAELPVIQANRGDTLDLGYRLGLIGPYDPSHAIYGMENLPPELIAQNYVILALLDWQQIPLNGNPYLFVAVEGNDEENMIHYGQFSIIVPDEPGLYEFIAFVFPNANYRKTFFSFLPISASVRFTIEIVD